MPPSQHFFTRVVGEYMRDRLKSQLQAELALKTCNYGDMDPFPTDDNLISQIVPAIFVIPQNLSSSFATINQRYFHDYTFRIAFVGILEEGITEEHLRGKIERIADVVVEDLRLDASTSPNYGSPVKAQTVWSVVRGIDYHPPEERFIATCNARLFCSTIDWQVKLLMFR